MDFQVELRLNNLINEKNLSVRALSRETGIRPGTLNNIVNQKTKSIKLEHIVMIAAVLKITDISKLISLEADPSEG